MEKQSYPKKTYTIRNKTEKVKISGLNTVSVRTQNTKTSIKVHKLKNNKKLSSKKHHHRVKKTSSQGQKNIITGSKKHHHRGKMFHEKHLTSGKRGRKGE